VAEQVGAGASVHLPFEHLASVDVALDGAGAPGEAEPYWQGRGSVVPRVGVLGFEPVWPGGFCDDLGGGQFRHSRQASNDGASTRTRAAISFVRC